MGTVTSLMPGMKELPKSAPKSVRSVMDTVLLTPSSIERWKSPPFQRPLKIGGRTSKLAVLIEELKSNGGVIPGILTLGKLSGETYLIDGQHRMAAFKSAGLGEGFADVRVCHFDSMGEMSEEFVQLNSSLVRLMNDDILRAEEANSAPLRHVRKACPFVGYSHIRAGANAPTVSMSVALRAWFASKTEAPNMVQSVFGGTPGLVRALDMENAKLASDFMNMAFAAWGSAKEYARLWSSANLTICMWIYRRTVLSAKHKVTKLSAQQFGKCLMALSASAKYLDWLPGRKCNERDRSPLYTRVKVIFERRLKEDGVEKPTFPGAEWAVGGTRRDRELV